MDRFTQIAVVFFNCKTQGYLFSQGYLFWFGDVKEFGNIYENLCFKKSELVSTSGLSYISKYHKNQKKKKKRKSGHPKKLQQFYHKIMHPKDANGMANIVDPDQEQSVSLIWVCTVC